MPCVRPPGQPRQSIPAGEHRPARATLGRSWRVRRLSLPPVGRPRRGGKALLRSRWSPPAFLLPWPRARLFPPAPREMSRPRRRLHPVRRVGFHFSPLTPVAGPAGRLLRCFPVAPASVLPERRGVIRARPCLSRSVRRWQPPCRGHLLTAPPSWRVTSRPEPHARTPLARSFPRQAITHYFFTAPDDRLAAASPSPPFPQHNPAKRPKGRARDDSSHLMNLLYRYGFAVPTGYHEGVSGAAATTQRGLRQGGCPPPREAARRGLPAPCSPAALWRSCGQADPSWRALRAGRASRRRDPSCLRRRAAIASSSGAAPAGCRVGSDECVVSDRSSPVAEPPAFGWRLFLHPFPLPG
jgi:hypothetical protein